MTANTTETYTLYRFFAADDTLLYVGLTVNPGRRMEKHRATQPWWKDDARIEMEQHADIATLRAAEREAIETEKPLFNQRMNSRTFRFDTLVWPCDICSAPIDDNDGYLTMSYAELHNYRAAVKAHDDRMAAAHPEWENGWRIYSLGELYDWPPRVAWQAFHGACDPDPESSDYWIGVERLRTPRALIGWCAHLGEKKWLVDTNWRQILHRFAEHT